MNAIANANMKVLVQLQGIDPSPGSFLRPFPFVRSDRSDQSFLKQNARVLKLVLRFLDLFLLSRIN